MSDYQIGLLLAGGVAVCWSGSSIAFSEAGRRIGSVPVNLIRLVMALLLLTAVCAASRHQALPTDATSHQWVWLAGSGVIGFFIGDLALFRAFVLVGPRISTLIMSLAPAFATIAAWLAFGENLPWVQWLGIVVTLAGVLWVVGERRPADAVGNASLPGVGLAMIGAIGQGVGVVMTRHAFINGQFDPFASTQIRILAAIPLFVLFVVLSRRTLETIRSLRNVPAMGLCLTGAIFGPVVGGSMLNASVARIPSGIASTLAGMVPVVMLPISALVHREKLTRRAVIGAVIAVLGVGLLAIADEPHVRAWLEGTAATMPAVTQAVGEPDR